MVFQARRTVEAAEQGMARFYRRHDRYWIPVDHPWALRFYMEYLFVPHSRRELLQRGMGCIGGEIFQKCIFAGPAEETLRSSLANAGIKIEPFPSYLILEDYPESQRRQTVVFLIAADAATPCAVAKVGSRSRKAVLEHEYRTLRALWEKLPQTLRESIPRPLEIIESDHASILLESFIAGRSIYSEMRGSWQPHRRVHTHFARARDWLVQFQGSTTVAEAQLNDAILREYVIGPLTSFQRRFSSSGRESEMIRYTIELAGQLSGERFPLVSWQGDFWARNLILSDGRLGVVDWERFRDRSVPFSDLFMFAASYGLSYPWRLSCWAEPTAAFRATFLERSWLAQLVRDYLLSYCEKMSVKSALLELFFPVFLAERALEENERFGWKDQKSEGGTWRRLFQEYAQHGGSICFG